MSAWNQYDTLVKWRFWRSLSLGSENGQNKAAKLNSPSPHHPPPRSWAWELYFDRSRFPMTNCETRTATLLVCVPKRKQKRKMRDNEGKKARLQSCPGRESNCASTRCARKISNWTNVQQHNTRWQQQVIRRMFWRGTTDESTRLSKASPDR